jgi:hypothetical protein
MGSTARWQGIFADLRAINPKTHKVGLHLGSRQIDTCPQYAHMFLSGRLEKKQVT